jgi:hypothetical protein
MDIASLKEVNQHLTVLLINSSCNKLVAGRALDNPIITLASHDASLGSRRLWQKG